MPFQVSSSLIQLQNDRLEFRWEVFNLLNHANFDLPNRIAFTPNFGSHIQRQEPRRDVVRSSASGWCSSPRFPFRPTPQHVSTRNN